LNKHFDCFETKGLHPRVKYLETVDSTNTEAKELVIQGEKEGFVIAAESQTKGRGRKDRVWLSPSGGLYFSIVLEPRLGFHNAPLLGLLGACAVARSLQDLGLKKVCLKWPNDVLIGNSKIAGILSEAVSVSDRTLGVVMGIGVNQNCPVADMPPGLRWPTTSIIDELRVKTSTQALLCSIVNQIDSLLLLVDDQNSFDVILDEWRKLSSTIGRRVRIHEGTETIDGTAKDIGSDGALIVEIDDGLKHVLIGDVSHLRDEE
jgi:BirA family biotin operon repressor/biotin-[acetyl-CoA-carboxylase] ligase